LLEGAPAMGMGGVVRSDGTHRKYTPYASPSRAALRFLRPQINASSNSSPHLP
jgi:hypothetical protein